MDNIAEKMVKEGTKNTNYYLIYDNGTWDGPFESVEHALEEKTNDNGYIKSVSVSAEYCGRIGV